MPPAESRDTPSLGIVLCVERGPLEAQAVLLCESLRAFGGRFRQAAVYAVAPRPGRRPPRATVAALEALDVTYLDETLDTGCAEYGSANRVAAAAHVERLATTELLAVLDTDTFFATEPAAFDLPAHVVAAARPVDVKGICTSGPEDPCDDYWRQLCACCGVSYDSLPLVTTSDGRATVKACYNGGLVVVRTGQGILGRWSECFLASVRRGLRPRAEVLGPIHSSTGLVPPAAARWWGSNQAALALALWDGTTAVEQLPPGYNYPLHMEAQLPPEHRARARADLVHVHYHYLLDAQALPASRLFDADGPLRPEQREWLRARVPLSPPADRRRRRQRGRQLVVAGMHRSGTSLVTSVLQRAGLDVGIDQGAGVGNPRGHFEDRDFFRLHEELLAAKGHTCFTAEGDLLPAPGTELAERARELVARRAPLPLWGWKDPRTCLFLDLWQPLLPEAAYLFLYRHPLDVALSLWRRNSDVDLQRDPLLAIRAWQLYNERLLAFRERHRERCFLAQVPAATRDLDALVERLAQRFRLPLRPGGLAILFDEPSLAPRLGPLDALAERLFPEAIALYRRLEEAADLPGAAPSAAGERERPAAPPAAAERGLAVALESLLVALLERRHRTAAEADLVRQRDELRGRLDDEERERQVLAAALAAERQAADELRCQRTALSGELDQQRREVDELRRVRAALSAALDQQRRAADELRGERDLLAAAAAQADAVCRELAATLAAIEGARSFAPVRGWWRLRRRLRRWAAALHAGRRRPPALPEPGAP